MKFTAHVSTSQDGSETTVDFEIDDDFLSGIDDARGRELFIEGQGMRALAERAAFTVWVSEAD